MSTSLERADAIADAVLYEGYLLYPYRASAAKNQARWQFGVLVPPSYAAEGTGEHEGCRTECLVEPDDGAHVRVRVRFLQVQSRTGGEAPSWDEAVDREIEVEVSLADLVRDDMAVSIAVPGEVLVEDGVRRTRLPLHGELRLFAEVLPGPYGVVRLRADVVNVSRWDGIGATRQEAVRHSLVAAHTVLSISRGRFLSLLEPPEWARGYVDGCVNEHTWPVLVGADDLVLSSPIILYDHPEIAPESTTRFMDATEIDEILALRTLTLTDEEKREARATDARAAELLDQVDELPREVFERLHGALRSVAPNRAATPWWDPGADRTVDPATDTVLVRGVAVGMGSRVVLRPGSRRADAQDMFLAGLAATVQGVFLDVDGVTHLAVTLDDDPAAGLQADVGRYRYFAPEEVEPR